MKGITKVAYVFESIFQMSWHCRAAALASPLQPQNSLSELKANIMDPIFASPSKRKFCVEALTPALMAFGDGAFGGD